MRVLGENPRARVFQFLVGRLKMRNRRGRERVRIWRFQFLVGRLKIRPTKLRSEILTAFQFLVGRLKILPEGYEGDEMATVSIPRR